jgi:hypothetical protein
LTPAHGQGFEPDQSIDLPSRTYFQVTRVDMRLCPSPLCGGVFVRQVNRRHLRCADGKIAMECHVPIIDWSALGLDPQAESQLNAEFSGRRVLARGELVLDDHGIGIPLPTLVVSDAWRGVTGNEPEGRFLGLVPSGIVCITYPCPTLLAVKLNRPSVRHLHDLDLTASGATGDEIAEGLESLHQGPGLLVAGTVRRITGPAGHGRELVANEFYTKVAGDSAGEECGPVLCGPGTRCCNPLLGICTPPDQACIQ